MSELSADLIINGPRYYDRDDYKATAKALDDLLERTRGRKFTRDEKRLVLKYNTEIDATRAATDVEVEKLVEADTARQAQRTEALASATRSLEEKS